jgi:hypothetical protein
MMRYVIEGCCQNPDHVKNRGERHFRDDMQRQLDGVAKNIKNFLYKTHRRNMRVLDSTYNTRHLPNEDIWFKDPVHPINSIYQHIASGVIKMAASLRDLEVRQDLKSRRSDSWDSRNQDRKPREATYSRQGNGSRVPSRGIGSYRGGHGGHGGHSGQQYRGLGGPRN